MVGEVLSAKVAGSLGSQTVEIQSELLVNSEVGWRGRRSVNVGSGA